MNTFGDSQYQFGLCDPQGTRTERARFRRESLPLLDKVNHFYCPTGCHSFKGWILLPRYEYDQLDTYSTSLKLNIGDTTKTDNTGTLNNLSIVQAQCVTRGIASDRNALYLVELTDGRGVLCNNWFQFPTTSNYNIRAAGYPQTFQLGSMNGGTTWTWTTMLQNLWVQMGTFLGTWPGLPYAPAGTPEGFWFTGVSAWQALCKVLNHLGMTVACDLTQTTNPFTIVQTGATDSTLTSLQARYTTHLEDDLEWIDTGAGRVPLTVRVFFKRRNSVYGTEETVRYDSFQWDMSPLYEVSISAPSAFSSAVGTHHLWSDFTVRYDQDNTPLAEDVTVANQIAQERVTQYYDMIAPASYMRQTYAGALPFTTGSRVDGVCWYRDYSDNGKYGGYGGWRTQIVYGPDPPWSDENQLWSK